MTDSTDRIRARDPAHGEGPIELSGPWARSQDLLRPGRPHRVGPRAPRTPLVDVAGGIREALSGGQLTEAMLASLASPTAPVQAALLTEALPVDRLRAGLADCYLRARHRQDDLGVELAVAAATTVENRRRALVERLLDDFQTNYPDLDDSVVAVVEGGATVGDPEHQGIFGDVDVTVFTVDDPGALARVSEALANSFAWTGYPLTPAGRNLTLDLHLFVQAVVPGGRGGLLRATPVRRQLGARNPCRFVSSAGLRWIVNQMYFAGRTLRGSVDRACQPLAIAVDEAAAFAADVTCHMSSALIDMPRTPTGDAAAEPAPALRRQQLTQALNEAKHVLRLIDAWLIHHPAGNALYHARFDAPRHLTRGRSYHARIVDDALLLVRSGEGGGTLRVGDEPLLRDLASLKLRTAFRSPWDVVGYDAGAEDRALALVGAMRALVRRILRDVAHA